MSAFKNKNSIAEAQLKRFEGIDRAKPIDDLSCAYDMENFRVMPNASLEKRCGFAPLADVNGAVRAVWSLRNGSDILTYIVHGNTVSVHSEKENSTTDIGKISTAEGFADFIFFDNILYLNDGSEFFWVNPDKITPVNAYIPLIGSHWASAEIGIEYEPLNYLTRRFRITYYVDKPVIYLCTKYAVASIDAVFVNGIRCSEDRYFYDPSFNALCVLNLAIGDTVAAYFTISDSDLDVRKALSYKQHAIYGTNDNNRLFLFGGVKDNIILASKKVDKIRMQAYESLYPDTLPIYMPKNSEVTLGQRSQRIMAACRHYDRLLIFTDKDTWMISNPSDDGQPLDATIINSSNGCTSPNGAILCENDPISVSNGTVLRWTRNTEELDESNAHSISQKIDSHLDDSFFHNAIIFLDRRRAEIFFCDPTSPSGAVWIYNFDTQNWFRFSGIGAKGFFEHGGDIGFYNDNGVYIFDENSKYDLIFTGSEPKEIVAYYESQPIDFSASPYKKRMHGIKLDANFDNGSILAECFCEKKSLCKAKLFSSKSSVTGVQERMNSPRFSHITLRLTAKGKSRQKIYKATLWAKA